MNTNRYLLITGIIFSLISLLHFIRALFEWQIQVDCWFVPIWVSWSAFVVAGFLCVTAIRLYQRRNKSRYR